MKRYQADIKAKEAEAAKCGKKGHTDLDQLQRVRTHRLHGEYIVVAHHRSIILL